MEDDAIAPVGHDAVAVADVAAGQPRPAIEAEQHLVAVPEAVDGHLVAVDGDLRDSVGLTLNRVRLLRFRHDVPVLRLRGPVWGGGHSCGNGRVRRKTAELAVSQNG